MVKFGKNKFKALNKLAKKQRDSTGSVSNKVIKKKINAEKKVSFQKEILIKEAASGRSPLVKNVPSESILNKLAKKSSEPTKHVASEDTEKRKLKPVEKKKKRRKTQISDAKLLLKLMKKKQA